MSRPPAPPYRNEGEHALWHVSDNPGIARFKPHLAPTSEVDEPRVWAIDTRHAPLYWFPRDCPRCTFWASESTSGEDVFTYLGGDRLQRVHVIEERWYERMAAATIYAYLLPDETFEPDPDGTTGYWVSRETVEPLDRVELGDLAARHLDAGIHLESVGNLWPMWDQVTASTLEFSGIRLRNAAPHPSATTSV